MEGIYQNGDDSILKVYFRRDPTKKNGPMVLTGQFIKSQTKTTESFELKADFNRFNTFKKLDNHDYK